MYLNDSVQGEAHDAQWLEEETFRKIARLSPHIIHIHRTDTLRLVFANHQLTKVLGYDAADLETWRAICCPCWPMPPCATGY